jgi:hypothetical protein
LPAFRPGELNLIVLSASTRHRNGSNECFDRG